MVLQRLQGSNVFVGENIPSHAQRLPEFDEGRPEPRKAQAELLGRLEWPMRETQSRENHAAHEAQCLEHDAEEA